jgi:hypothetical protein
VAQFQQKSSVTVWRKNKGLTWVAGNSFIPPPRSLRPAPAVTIRSRRSQDCSAAQFNNVLSTTANAADDKTRFVRLLRKGTMTQEYVSLKDLADELGLTLSWLRIYTMRNGVKPHKRRTADSRNQLRLAVTAEEAEWIRAKRREEGFFADCKAADKDAGVFYVIQLVPELDARRLKLGFADDLALRLAQHRTAAPTARVVKSWPCRRVWEFTVMDCLVGTECRLILNEVYECDDINALLARGDQLFQLLPDPATSAQLADASPRNT